MNWRRFLPGYRIAELETECRMLREQLSGRDERIITLEAEAIEKFNYILLLKQSPPLDAVRRRTQGQPAESPRHFNPRSARRESFENAMKANDA